VYKKKEKVNIIVMGTYGRTGIEHFFSEALPKRSSGAAPFQFS